MLCFSAKLTHGSRALCFSIGKSQARNRIHPKLTRNLTYGLFGGFNLWTPFSPDFSLTWVSNLPFFNDLFFSNRGNALLIGSIGTHLNSLAALALYMLEYPIHPVDCSYPNTFLDGLRSAVRQAGCDGKTTTVLFTVSIDVDLNFQKNNFTSFLFTEIQSKLVL